MGPHAPLRVKVRFEHLHLVQERSQAIELLGLVAKGGKRWRSIQHLCVQRDLELKDHNALSPRCLFESSPIHLQCRFLSSCSILATVWWVPGVLLQ